MNNRFLIPLFLSLNLPSFSQEISFDRFLADSSMRYAAVSFCIINADSNNTIFDYNSSKSLIPASILKTITTSAALELLGPEYTFKTGLGYSGTLKKRSGRLSGNIIIQGGGDPALGSANFPETYSGFPDSWISEIKKLGIRKIEGRVITDDSYYDYLPVPAKWLWEDAGNYYGAGAYGLSVFDNTYEIHFQTTSDSTDLMITGISPEECRFEFSNWLVAAGTADRGYVFAAPYSTNGWLAGSIPVNTGDFVLKASIADPPLIMARALEQKLKSAGISVSLPPTTTRLMQSAISDEVIPIAGITSPPLRDIIKVLNQKSVNLYAETLLKQLGKVFKNKGSTESGIEVVKEFLEAAGINSEGMFLEDGSGLSPLDAVNARGMVSLLSYMKNRGKYFNDFYASMPAAGLEGTLKDYFKDPAFESRMKAKSGSMTRVRSYAGYITTMSGNNLIFCIIVNNYTGKSADIIAQIESILKEVIMSK